MQPADHQLDIPGIDYRLRDYITLYYTNTNTVFILYYTWLHLTGL
jgi:hypothetical protein